MFSFCVVLFCQQLQLLSLAAARCAYLHMTANNLTYLQRASSLSSFTLLLHCTFVCIAIAPVLSIRMSHLHSTLLKRLLCVNIWDPFLSFHLHRIVPTSWQSNIFVKILPKDPSVSSSHSKTRQLLPRQTCTSSHPFFHLETQS